MGKQALYVVATPLGNLGDMTHRAVAVLAAVDVIAAEDTRHSRRLLQHYGIATPCVALHEHNEARVAPQLVRRIEGGEAVALISDAGTPLISDPGYALVRLVQEAGCRVVPVPGPSALIAALSAAGLPNDRFAFEGFLPAKGGARLRRLEALRDERRTLVFYEAPHRIISLLEALCQVFSGEREAAVARELTKAFETIRRDCLATLLQWVAADPRQQKGEFVVLVHGAAAPQSDEVITVSCERLLSVLLAQHSLKEAVALAAELSGLRRNRLYELAVRLRGHGGDE
ncbi:MAG: 16S rRNA (cytidine(1402)-2'-O)-methyltransferase [Gammaproteobacteria bacterium]